MKKPTIAVPFLNTGGGIFVDELHFPNAMQFGIQHSHDKKKCSVWTPGRKVKRYIRAVCLH